DMGGAPGDGDCEEELFTVEDCQAADGPNDKVLNSCTGAFAEGMGDWMEGWTNFSIDSSGVSDDAADTILDEDIDSDMTLTADKIWELQGTVHVLDGATLTIEPGTVIK